MIWNEKTCLTTGLQPNKLPFGTDEGDERCTVLKRELHKALIREIQFHKVQHFLVGFYPGSEIFTAEILCQMKTRYPNLGLILEGILPCASHTSNWNRKDRDRYFTALEQCDLQTNLQRGHSAVCIQRRNEQLVRECDFVLAVWDGSLGLIAHTIQYAEEMGKPVTILSPDHIGQALSSRTLEEDCLRALSIE